MMKFSYPLSLLKTTTLSPLLSSSCLPPCNATQLEPTPRVYIHATSAHKTLRTTNPSSDELKGNRNIMSIPSAGTNKAHSHPMKKGKEQPLTSIGGGGSTAR
jgi:hypothetical protein